jgi:uncharacterized DUF497 family protein
MVMDDDELQFCWDDSKGTSNLEKHDVSFEAAAYVFDDPMKLERDDVFAEGEYRSIVTGRVDDMLLTVVYSMPEDNLCRIISARPATARERNDYEQNLFHS